jgi:hypothetical protein
MQPAFQIMHLHTAERASAAWHGTILIWMCIVKVYQESDFSQKPNIALFQRANASVSRLYHLKSKKHHRTAGGD